MGNPYFVLGGRSWEREGADEDEEAEGKNQKKMGGEVLKDRKLRQQPVCLSRRAILWAFYSIVLLFLLRSYLFQESPLPSSRKLDNIDQGPDDRDHRHHHRPTEPTCDLAQGQWVHDASPPPYHDSTCNTIKEGQNCIAHGRPDTGYLHWRWQPHNCTLPRFDPSTFLSLIANQKLMTPWPGTSSNPSSASSPNTPDAHPGPYMHPSPFAGGLKERVQNDCVHWCLPGTIDTWNIFLEMVRRWRRKDARQ